MWKVYSVDDVGAILLLLESFQEIGYHMSFAVPSDGAIRTILCIHTRTHNVCLSAHACVSVCVYIRVLLHILQTSESARSER